MTEKCNWHSPHNPPPIGLMVLVRTRWGVALGCFSARGAWHVQPYKARWYETRDGVREWKWIEGDEDDRQAT